MISRDPQIANGIKGEPGLGFDGVTSYSYADNFFPTTVFSVNKIGAFIVGGRIRAVGQMNGGWLEGVITAINTTPSLEFVVSIDSASADYYFDYLWNITVGGSKGGWSTEQSIRVIGSTSDYPSSSDAGKLLTIESSGSVNIYIEPSLSLSPGQRIDFVWIGPASSVTFIGSSVSLYGTPGLNLRTTYSAATLICIYADYYVLVGDLSA